MLAQNKTPLGFFITSVGSGDGANLGGMQAPTRIAKLAAAAGAGNRTWRAYLSGVENGKPVNAKDRIGPGPWFNAKGEQIAANVAELHSEAAKTGRKGRSPRGAVVNGRGDKPNTHDILTGSQLDGTAFTDAADHTCKNWTSNSAGARRSATTIGRAAARTRRHGTARMRRRAVARTTWWPPAAPACSTALP